jgi:hypothetical protein
MWPPNKNPPGYFPPTSSSIAQNTQNHQISSFSQEQHIPPSPQPSGSYYNHGGLLQMVTGQGQPFQNMPISMFSPTFGNMNSQQQYFGNNALLSNQQQYFWHPGQTDNRTANKTTLYSLPTYHYWNQQQQQYTMPQGNENV